MADRQISGVTARTLALTDVIPTQDAAGASEAGKNTIQEVKNLLVPKEYMAIISQSSTSAPTVVVISNTLGGTVVWSRNGVGDYSATLSSAFTSNKTFITTMNQQLPIGDRTAFFSISSTSVISMLTRKISDNTAVDLQLSSSMVIEIKVYP